VKLVRWRLLSDPTPRSKEAVVAAKAAVAGGTLVVEAEVEILATPRLLK
jgi:hypothetical protein